MSADAGPVGSLTKKPKRRRPARDNQTSSSASLRVSLTSLPIEILADILLYTCSPPTVLAVSRTCSFLYRTLAQNPSASFIWRGVRETCRPAPVPDPTPGWNKSEADYAAFVFGGGVCEACGRSTRAPYVSFAARIRLCGSWYCRRKFLKESIIDATELISQPDREVLRVPYVEDSTYFYPIGLTEPENDNDKMLFRKTDFEKHQRYVADYRIVVKQTQAEIMRAARSPSFTDQGEDKHVWGDLDRYAAAVQRFNEIMKLSERLAIWKCDYEGEYKYFKKENKIWTKNLAESEGWDLKDLLASQTYGSLQCRKTLLMERIEFDDVSSIRSMIEAELLAMQVHHKRQKAEKTYKEKLTEVKKIYERMRCGTVEGSHTGTADNSDPPNTLILPTLSVFCTLPFVRTLKGSPDPSMIPPSGSSSASDIQLTSLTTSLIMSDIHTWLVPVQKHLMTLLGHSSEWQSASTRTLHPLRRVTARFFCKRCGEGNVGRKYQRERCLDLKGVCSHVCKGGQGKHIGGQRQEVPENNEVDVTDSDDGNKKGKRRKGEKKSHVKSLDWKVDTFEKDEKVIRVIKTILNLTGLSDEEPSTISILKEKGDIIRCLSCTGWIVMDFATAIGHARRHESMQIQLMSKFRPIVMEGDTSVDIAFRRGITEFLLGPAYRGRKLREKANYGCKHCIRVSGNNSLKMNGKAAKPMDFNALRSHVKAKHGIQDICDEDFFCHSSLQIGGE